MQTLRGKDTLKYFQIQGQKTLQLKTNMKAYLFSKVYNQGKLMFS